MPIPDGIRAHALEKKARYDILEETMHDLASQKDDLERRHAQTIKGRDACQQAFGGQAMAAHLAVSVNGLAHDLQICEEQLGEIVAEREGIWPGIEALLLGHLYDTSVDVRNMLASMRATKEAIEYSLDQCEDFLRVVGIGLRDVTEAQHAVPVMGQFYILTADTSKIISGINIINTSIKMFNATFRYDLIEKGRTCRRIRLVAAHRRLCPMDYVLAAQHDAFAVRDQVHLYQSRLRQTWRATQEQRHEVVRAAIDACRQDSPYR